MVMTHVLQALYTGRELSFECHWLECSQLNASMYRDQGGYVVTML